ncbi:hypothetical protein K402DRAFT_216215 [Aulographum hederae CBS 113979]|uniref:Uncharacterized protein n=1 Tax=Aulographum hederae CBS 113979 TaxID=1176131 RepID=A0A6G1GMK3_9PEZI|nr:hypothetical protein K402DRAFT_216215 [Aulographum hederae CBS 113979]
MSRLSCAIDQVGSSTREGSATRLLSSFFFLGMRTAALFVWMTIMDCVEEPFRFRFGRSSPFSRLYSYDFDVSTYFSPTMFFSMRLLFTFTSTFSSLLRFCFCSACSHTYTPPFRTPRQSVPLLQDRLGLTFLN